MMRPLLELKDVTKQFELGGKRQTLALNRLNLTIAKGESLGLVGESGCGKSTLARVIMGVYPPTSGTVYYDGIPLSLKSRGQRKEFALHAQMVFQDPYQSLDPHMTAESIIEENLVIHFKQSTKERKERVCELLEMTGLSKEQAARYPHEFSGGQRQRIGIARALAVGPELLICDEPLSALDISVRSQIINLMLDLNTSLGLTYLFISHDLNVVHHISDRIAVMYAGRIVELGPAREIYEEPLHPYTQMLLQAVLQPTPSSERLTPDTLADLQETAASLPTMGCPFAGRCPCAHNTCRENNPPLAEVTPGHCVACHIFAGTMG